MDRAPDRSRDLSRSCKFPRSHRLRSRPQFSAVFDAGVKRVCGPLVCLVRANDLDHWRLGLAVPRRVGTAVRRNRIKRLLRESFRLLQHELPGDYDLVIVVRPHAPLKLPEYQRLLADAAGKLDRAWRQREPGAPKESQT